VGRDLGRGFDTAVEVGVGVLSSLSVSLEEEESLKSGLSLAEGVRARPVRRPGGKEGGGGGGGEGVDKGVTRGVTEVVIEGVAERGDEGIGRALEALPFGLLDWDCDWRFGVWGSKKDREISAGAAWGGVGEEVDREGVARLVGEEVAAARVVVVVVVVGELEERT
jgi:hypothetical protein